MRIKIKLILFFIAVFPLNAVDYGLTEKLADKLLPSFVFVAGGSGVLISSDGYIITNNHVVGNRNRLGVTLGDGRTFRAELIGRDRRGDLALLKIQGASSLPYMQMGDSDKLKPGQYCLAVGNPLALGMRDQYPSFSKGVISALHQFRKGYNDAIVVDAAINPGNSGGPLVDSQGKLIGINGMTQTRMGIKSNTGLGYAIPSNQIKLWLPFLKAAKGGNVFHGRISGLELEENDGIVRVKSVPPGTEGYYAGFREGDIIQLLSGKHMPSIVRFNSVQGMYPAGSTMSAEILRDNKKKKLRFELPPLRPWKRAFTLAKPNAQDEYPKIGMVITGSAADRAGIKPGDEITSINNIPVKMQGIARLSQYIANLCAGDRVNFVLLRDNTKVHASFIAE